MPIHTLVSAPQPDPENPDVEQVLPRPAPLAPPPEPNTAVPSPIAAVLSESISFTQAKSQERMVLRDQHGRVLCIHKSGSGDWGWAYLGDPDNYSADIAPLLVQVDSTNTEVVLTVEEGLHDWSLFANGNASSWEYVFAGWKPWHDYPRLRFHAKTAGTTVVNNRELRVFNLGYLQGSHRMVLHADEGSWNWLKVCSVDSVPRATLCRFTLHKLIVPVSRVSALVAQTWPKVTLNYRPIVIDKYYEVISEQQAHMIWDNAGLKQYKFMPEVFDCDDFSMAYKTQAAKDAYALGALHPYAVGIILGRDQGEGHSANLFINQRGDLHVIEPQTGAVQRASEWRYVPEYVIM